MDRVYRADEQRHHSRHFVSEVRIQHFRSFGPEAVVRFFRGFNVLVGANGVGKSNVLDATLFALGQDATQMRLRTWTELSNRSRRGPCAVTVTLSNGIEETRLLAIVKDEANRVLRLNGTVSSVQACYSAHRFPPSSHPATTLSKRRPLPSASHACSQQIRQALQQRGINVESPYLCIRQSAAAALLDSGELGRALLASSFFTSRTAANATSSFSRRLQKEQGVLSRVRADIASLEAMVGKDGEAMRALQEIRALRSRARAVRRSAGALHTQLCHAAAAAREKETAGVASRMARCGREAKQLHEQVEAVGARTQAAREAAEACAAVAATARTVEEEARAAAEDAEAALIHACVQAEETREEQRSWDKARAKEGCALEDVREAESERLRGRLLALRQESLHAEEALQQLGGGEARCEGAGGSVRSPARREILAWVDRAENEAKQGHDASVAAEAYAQTLLREAIEQLQQAATEEVSRLFARCNEATLAAANAALLAPADKLETFQAEEAAAVESVGQSAMEAESAGFHLRLYEDQRGVETLCTAMRLRRIARSPTSFPHSTPPLLRHHCSKVIAGRHLGVRIMATSEEAVRAIERARGKGQALRVWPLDRLRRSDHTKEHTKLQHIYGSRVIPPLSLVDPSPQHTIAIQNAFGRPAVLPNSTFRSILPPHVRLQTAEREGAPASL
ncbi:hypothetical protein AB1Y20_005842 [Prymnesium parvum]|uniref:RecF/RecN/SMC N-terminal domain-containing protein n=1 Tax=Prymnesium parvum TaxID=97485 RepID=A0AB34J2C1_PRYPA